MFLFFERVEAKYRQLKFFGWEYEGGILKRILKGDLLCKSLVGNLLMRYVVVNIQFFYNWIGNLD